MESKRFEFSDVPLIVLAGRLARLGGSLQAKIESGSRIVSIWIVGGRIGKVLGLSNPNNLDDVAWIEHGNVTISNLNILTVATDCYKKLNETINNAEINILLRYPFFSTLFLKKDDKGSSNGLENIQPNHIDLLEQGIFFEDIPNNSRDDQKSITRILCMESVSQTAYTKLGTIINTIQEKVLSNVKDYFGGIVKANIKRDISDKIEAYKSETFDDIFETNISGSAPYRFWMKTIQDCASKNLPLDMVQKWIAKSVDKLPPKDKPIVEMVLG
jgi:hypothetical protein